MWSSSIATSSGRTGISENSCDPRGNCDAKWRVPSVVSLPTSVIVARDHCSFGSLAASFRESMRRDAMTGTKIAFALRGTGVFRSLESRFYVEKKGNPHAGHQLDRLLNMRTG